MAIRSHTFLSAALLAAAAFTLTACESANEIFGIGGEDLTQIDPAGIPLPNINGQREWAGTASAAAIDMTVVVTDERGWRILWQLAGALPPGAFPPGGMAVAVFNGPRPTAGYSVDIPRIRFLNDTIVVDYVETFPAADMAVAQITTAPYAIEIVRDIRVPVLFNRLDPVLASTQMQMQPVVPPQQPTQVQPTQ